MSFRPMVLVGREWAGNALRFATREEAEASARDLACRWTLVLDHRADESDDPVNCAWVGRNVHLWRWSMRERHIKDFPVSEKPGERTVVRCHVAYSKGGINVWTYKDERRGYWLHVQPMVLERRDGYSVQRFVPMRGRKLFLLEAKRFSEKGMHDAVLLGQEALLRPEVSQFIEECVRVPVEA